MSVRACLICGGPTPPSTRKPFKYCASQACRAEVARRRVRDAWRATHNTCRLGFGHCLDCGALFTYRASNANPLLRCRVCWPAWKKRIQAESQRRLTASRRPCPLGRATKVVPWDRPVRVRWRPPIRVRSCTGCGDALSSKYGKWCSDRCYNRCRYLDGSTSAIAYGTCSECGALFVRRQGRVGGFCGEDCRRRAQKRTRRHRQRTNGPSEQFTLREIADRDGWRCHLCGKKVNPRLNPQHERAASIDHLIPVSDEGRHLRENVALAHRKCNSVRGVGGIVQLRLVG